MLAVCHVRWRSSLPIIQACNYPTASCRLIACLTRSKMGQSLRSPAPGAHPCAWGHAARCSARTGPSMTDSHLQGPMSTRSKSRTAAPCAASQAWHTVRQALYWTINVRNRARDCSIEHSQGTVLWWPAPRPFSWGGGASERETHRQGLSSMCPSSAVQERRSLT